MTVPITGVNKERRLIHTRDNHKNVTAYNCNLQICYKVKLSSNTFMKDYNDM